MVLNSKFLVVTYHILRRVNARYEEVLKRLKKFFKILKTNRFATDVLITIIIVSGYYYIQETIIILNYVTIT